MIDSLSEEAIKFQEILRKNEIIERFMQTIEKDKVDCSKYENFEDGYRQLKHGLEVFYVAEHQHHALDYLTLAEFE